jgi:BlaI family penicillinase repressor
MGWQPEEGGVTKSAQPGALGRRERQIMDVVHRLGAASVADVRANLPDPPTYSSVRGMLRHLETKGYVAHQAEDLRYVYRPTASPAAARRSALRHIVHTFFGGSASEAAASLLELGDAKLSDADARRLTQIIRKSREEAQ